MNAKTNQNGADCAAQFQTELSDFISKNPQVEQVHIMFPDMNCTMRGKSISIAALGKLPSGGVKMPFSTHGLSVWGKDVEGTGLALETGDPDGVFIPILGSLSLSPSNPKLGQILTQLRPLQVADELVDPRDILAAMLNRFSTLGLKPVLATEVEFYLMSDQTLAEGPPMPIASGKAQRVNEIDALVDQQGFIDSVRQACMEQNIAIDTIISEYGRGQFEINMLHTDDVLLAADHAVLFRHLVRHCAKKHGMRASFMAKPMADQPGSGLHVHLSVLNQDGVNIFASDDDKANPKLLNAVAGVLSGMADFQAIFAPHANSYRRFQAHSHAPTNLSWGYDHRGVAVRIPEARGKNARLEHRVCGADANPYLLLTAILAGVLQGLEAELQPVSVAATGALEGDEKLTNVWPLALDCFENSALAKSAFGVKYHHIYLTCRAAEMAELAAMIPDIEYQAYLHRI